MLLVLALSPSARADIGPPPTCPDGTHRQYLQGNHCVKDGFRLEIGPDGTPREVADAPLTTPPATPETPPGPPSQAPAPGPSSTIPEAAPPPAAPASSAESSRCATTPAAGAWLALAGVLTLALRRR